MTALESQSAFVRGFIDDETRRRPRPAQRESQSAFVRGFIDDDRAEFEAFLAADVSIRVRARLHR